MVAAIMIFPSLVTGGIEKTEMLNKDQIMEQMLIPKTEEEIKQEAEDAKATEAGAEAKPADGKEEDPMKAILEANEKDKKK
jgi:hypothetical protein